MSEEEKESDKKKVTTKKLWLFIGVIFGIWGGSWIGVNCLINETERGTFGDQFGAVNALFSGLAFAGLIYTILLQHEELGLQRQELADTREELKGQKEEAEKQNAIMKKQQFENTFFQLLQVHHNIVNGIHLAKKWGREVFRNRYMALYKEIADSCQATYTDMAKVKTINEKKAMDLNFVNKVFGQHYDLFLLDAGLYFRNLYRIVKYIDEHPILLPEEKYEYIAMLRSQLSDYELAWMFYNCISLNGFEKFKPLIEKYALLHNLPSGILVVEKHRTFYEPGAFERVTV
ncbi:putative phage abortive infection protein [uncultured Butyricimonas sp.]|uniref:putative phage abortive infection protein n=1 Tax=uncultured Butyricimonas sp. TaxID=1268785 RepID=UPI0026DC376C|nr:putative phage abortive infection protein [uncultured Butyricimonas sp.]